MMHESDLDGEEPMPLQLTKFDDDRVETCGMGGGVLPIAFDEDGTIHVLLGRERYISSWRGSCRWSGFEGCRKDGETMDATCVREFDEESLGLVMRKEDSHRMIRDRLFWIRIVLSVRCDRRPERYHCSYVVVIPWNPNLAVEFQELRAHLEYVDRLMHEWRLARPIFLGEHSENVGPVVDLGDEVHVFRARDDLPCVVVPPWTDEENNDDVDGGDTVKAVVIGDQAVELREWASVRDRTTRAINPSHDAVRVVRDEQWGLVQDVSVRNDYLEKDIMKWWSVKDLKRVMQARGQLGPDRFRPFFLPVLQTLLTEIEARPPHPGMIMQLDYTRTSWITARGKCMVACRSEQV